MISWIVGRGGLLGHAVESALEFQGNVWHPAAPFTWSDPEKLQREFTAATESFADAAGSGPWQIAWCAGAGVVASSSDGLSRETSTFRGFLECVTATICRRPGLGTMFLASSAGGVYSGVFSPPYDERSTVEPLSSYGWSKLDLESVASEWSRTNGVPLLIGRITNLYGPGQDLSKGQGLISQVCLRVMMRQPLVLYVPLDTIRDYIYSADAGHLVARGLARLRLEAIRTSSVPTIVKIVGSQQPTTIATVLAQFRWITRHPVSVIVASSPNTSRQPLDLRMRSIVWPELDQGPKTTLSEGMRRVTTDLLRLVGAGELPLRSLEHA